MSSEIKIVEQTPVPMLSVREKIKNAEIKSKIGEMFGQLWMYMEKNKIVVAGPPFVVYHEFDSENCDMESGFPTLKEEKGEGNIRSSQVPGGRCVMAVHEGPYDTIMATYERIQNYMRQHDLVPKQMMWERYMNDPATVKDPNELVTEIYWPID
jgi:effector-binding domain-containing protein